MKWLLLTLLLLTGCISSIPIQKLNPATYYVNDVCVTNHIDKKNSTKFCGVGVLPYQDSYDFTIENKGKLNFFSMTSCHREKTTENYDKSIFKKDGRIRISYKPTLEKGKACALYIAAYNRKGRHGWAAIFFEHPKYKLKAKVECNGKIRIANGVSVCQARKELIERITFENEVVPVKPVNGPAERKQPCPVLLSKDNKVFEFLMPTRECIYGFVERKTRKIHMFNTIGYEQLIIRE